VGGEAGSVCGRLAQKSSPVLDDVFSPLKLNTKHADILEKKKQNQQIIKDTKDSHLLL
jgi:hypothetical protein